MKSDSTILLTGGCGFIGTNFVRLLLAQRPDYRIINLDALSYSGNPANLADLKDEPRYRFVHGNVCDRKLVGQLVTGADAVVHMAAESHVDRSLVDATPFFHSNVIGTQTIVDAVRDVSESTGSARRCVYVSTDEVYGSLPLDKPELRFTESTPIRPNSPYAASKAAGDLLVAAAHHTFGLDLLITRCSNNIGPYQYPEKLIPLFATNLLQGKKVPLYGDGKNVRDWVHVEDHCEAILAVLEKGKAGQAYNIGGNNERSNLEVTHSILEIMGHGQEMIQPVEDRLGHDRRYAIDASKIKAELGWEPSRSAWPAALEQTVAWYAEHEKWWGALKGS
jgi:dTDP-glucose 4,6-dehydratase